MLGRQLSRQPVRAYSLAVPASLVSAKIIDARRRVFAMSSSAFS